MRLRNAELVEYLEAVYHLEVDGHTWLTDVMEASRRVWGRNGWVHGGIYDASDVTAFRVIDRHVIGGSEAAIALLARCPELFTPGFVSRSFRVLAASMSRKMAEPELGEVYSGMEALGYPDCLGINGINLNGLGVFIGLWDSNACAPSVAEMNVYRRMAYHLAAAHRCRQRLHETQPAGSSVDPTVDAEAILDARGRVLHATGEAKQKHSQAELVATSRARDLARTSRGDNREGLRRWYPLTSARWTLVDSFERSGQRYVVARENQPRVTGLNSLSDRERQVVAYLAIGQSTKETAYALGISDATVRVLLARAAAKLGVKARHEMLQHPEVRPLVPHGQRT